MWNRIKGMFGGSGKPPGNPGSYDFKWHEPGGENRFPVRILDVRPLTQTVVATTSDQSIAEKYSALRGSDGKELIGATIADAVWLPGKLTFPHNGAALDGIVFKADSMDVKWDIYIYDGCFLFARSWTGELRYRARVRVESAALVITEIECTRSEADIARAHVFFLLATHAMRRVLPHQLPKGIPEDPMAMGTLSFNLFGNRAFYATFEDITRIPLAT